MINLENIEELQRDINERELLLCKLDKSNPLYPIMEFQLKSKRELYEIMLISRSYDLNKRREE